MPARQQRHRHESAIVAAVQCGVVGEQVLSVQVVIPAFNAAGVIVPTLRAVLAQQVPADTALTVTVVDDGSTDGTADAVRQAFGERVSVCVLARNSGRGNAINAGVQAGSADYLIILDADCVPADGQAIARFVQYFRDGAQVVAGQASSSGDGFWARYIRDTNTRRARLGGVLQMTTPFCGIRRGLFLAVGGFLPDYRHYGFEDRDLLLRLRAAAGSDAGFVVAPGIVASHEDRMRAAVVLRKMQEAARHSAPVFIRQHPEAYARMDLARMDRQSTGCLWRSGLYLLLPLLPLLQRRLDAWLDSPRLPYRCQCWLLRLGSALAYFQGSRQR